MAFLVNLHFSFHAGSLILKPTNVRQLVEIVKLPVNCLKINHLVVNYLLM